MNNMSVYESFFLALSVEMLIVIVLFALNGAWKLGELIFDDENGYGFNIFDEIEKHEHR
jgi:hypothetical protein